MTPAQVAHWDAKAREQFVYLADGALDTWRSHADEVLAGFAWEGDCDDLVSTALDLMARAGLPLASCYRLIVDAAGKPGDHRVGAALGDDGALYIVGDTFAACYPAGAMAHVPGQYQRMDEAADHPERWRQGAPWGGLAA